MELETTHPKPHAIMFPLCFQGHIIPTVHLALKLASKGFTITFINTESTHHQIIKSRPQDDDNDEQDIFAGARKSGLDIRYKTMTDGFPLSFNRILNLGQFCVGLLHVFPVHVDEIVGNIVGDDPSVSCLIADTFYPWPSTIAKKYNLVHISFWTEPVLVFTLYYHVDLLVINGHFASHDNREDTIDYIPGVQAIEPKDLISYLQQTDVSTATYELIFKAFESVKKADYILCNTVEELEPHAISGIREKQPIYAIGPLFSIIGQNGSIVATSLRSQSDCKQWLDTKPHGSVLYISFGSLAPLNELDVEEIAQGLLLSKVSFVWVLRPDSVSYSESYVLPVGFEDEIKDRGLIVPWCNQIEVISHPAVGGFLTHCGWNSILESIWYGVPMLCFPIFTDQPTNRKIVVDDWKVGLNLCDKKPLTRLEVGEKINRLMSGKSAEELREEMKKVKEIVENAADKDGLSEKAICEFICQVKAKIDKGM
ncbi:UDP-glycosyltransferase 86A1 [Ziziphus jujuba]|uniref:Glycosyltransferase n=1 Tax=Ziziphus jujuba TaxID=326968 RepID=A0A6P4AKT1_ZIZJJ|nr:UDP-glycosyltransferase 86A1 [Ziziphus jujuba]